MLLTLKEIAERLFVCETTARVYLGRFGILKKRMFKRTVYEISVKKMNEMVKFSKEKGRYRC